MKDLLKGIVFAGLFAIPLLPLLVADSMFFPFITGKNFAFRIIVEIVFAAWILLALLDTAYRPRFSWMAAGGAAMLVVMLFANMFGEYPLQSFWSNFERMDGYVTLVHFYLLFLVIGSFFQTPRMWNIFFHTSLAVALVVGLYGLAQQSGVVDGGRDRLDSTLGNAAYMAVYMLFHIFILVLVALRSKDWFHRALYTILMALFVYILLQTGTRGTFIGLVSGGVITAGYLILFSRSYPKVRTAAVGAITVVVALVALLFYYQDATFVQESTPLRRIANISLEDLTTRGTIWSMAWEGVQERPILGWGQENFNYVFNQNYHPSLHSGEPWFDRVHNIVLDWLIAGGVLGFATYLSIFLGCVYYLLWRPFFRRDGKDDPLSIGERSVLAGLLGAYFIHNLAVFDNIVSYIFFAIILGYLHSVYSREIPRVVQKQVPEQLVTNIALPAVLCVLGLSIYFVNVPGILAANDILDGYNAPTVQTRLEAFERALTRGSFAQQEIVEQAVQQTLRIIENPNVPQAEKEALIAFSERELQNLVEEKPGDARLHMFFSTFYRVTGDLESAREQAAIAHSLSPTKQSIILEQGIIEYFAGDDAAATQFFQEAYELDHEFPEAKAFYVGMLLRTGQIERATNIVDTPKAIQQLAFNQFAFAAAAEARASDLLAQLLQARIEAEPEELEHRTGLAYVHYQEGDVDAAVEVLEAAIADFPEFTQTGNCFIANLRAGTPPESGCFAE